MDLNHYLRRLVNVLFRTLLRMLIRMSCRYTTAPIFMRLLPCCKDSLLFPVRSFLKYTRTYYGYYKC